MSRAKLVLIGLCLAVVGLMGVANTSAQAMPEWTLLNAFGERRTGSELPFYVEGKQDFNFWNWVTHLVHLKVEVRCTSVTLVNARFEAGGKIGTGMKFQLGGCKIFNAATSIELPECGVKSSGSLFGTVTTASLKGQLQTSGEIKIEPVTGATLATLEFEVGCVLPSPTTFNGVIVEKDCEGKLELHLKEHLWSLGSEAKLWVGSDTAEHLETSIPGSIWLALESPHQGLKWGAQFP